MSLIKELIEDMEKDSKIVKSFIPKDSLPDSIFTPKGDSYVIKEEIREKLLQITNEFLDFIGIDFFVHDIVLTGSLSNYNWSEYSDVDLHILIDMDEFDGGKVDSIIYHQIVKEFFDSKKVIWNTTTDIKIKDFEVELYIQDIDEEHVSTGVYSILNNEWVVEPKKLDSPFELDEKKILEKSEEYAKQIDLMVKTEKSGDDNSDEVDELKMKIKKFRQCGLEKGGEYSYENLTFKLLRRNGYIEKLMNIKKTARDKKLSLPQ